MKFILNYKKYVWGRFLYQYWKTERSLVGDWSEKDKEAIAYFMAVERIEL